MIVRILEDGQYEITNSTVRDLESLDADLEAAITARDESRFRASLSALISSVHAHGQRLDPTAIVPSDYTVPHESATLEEVVALLSSESVDES